MDCCLANSWLSGFMEQEEAAKGTINERLKVGNSYIHILLLCYVVLCYVMLCYVT